MSRKVIIVGGVAGGASAAARLRRLDEAAEILLIEKGAYVSFANCGLPYYIGEIIENRGNLMLMTPGLFMQRFNIDVRVKHEVLHLDALGKTMEIKNLETGEIFTESFTDLILSPGSQPLKPPIPGITQEGIFTLWTIPDTDAIYNYIEKHQPKRAVVVGGGFIGLEMAENLAHRGIEVSLVEMLDQVMAPIDFDMAQMLHENMREIGVDLHLSTKVLSFDKDEKGLVVNLDGDKNLKADMILLSLGVKPQTAFLQDSGLDFGPRGHLLVDDHLETNIKGIYAVGDAIEVINFTSRDKTAVPLAGPANKQGRMAADNIVLNNAYSYKGSQGTSIAQVFDYTVGSTGLNEKNLTASGKIYRKDYDIALISMKNHASYYPGSTDLTIKALFTVPQGKLLGCQVLGSKGVDKHVDVFAAVQRMGGTTNDLKELESAYAPPFNSAKDPMNMVGFVAENILEGMVKFRTAMHLARDKPDTILLDVQENEERMLGYIEGSIHIPQTELRNRLGELDKEQDYTLYCAVGVRSYIASRILEQEGFKNVYVLSVGLSAWNSFNQDKRQIISRSQMAAMSGARPDEIHQYLNVSGAQCPGPILQVAKTIEMMNDGEVMEVIASDQGFYRDIPAWSQRTGNTLISVVKEEGKIIAILQKGSHQVKKSEAFTELPNGKTIVVFSGDLDKAIASLIIANGAVSMGRQVTMFYTFWGLNILRKTEKQAIKKPFIQKAFSTMMPRGATKLRLSQMNFGGVGAKLIKKIMKDNNVDSVESLLQQAIDNGVNMIACTMSMELMGIHEEELIDGVDFGGVAAYLGEAEMADTNLFI
ncbi:MAG: FAD-dependent oxidoreductase [Tissierellia bacterium]|nr:FAD-dependent oxidoreductase [Tissierellia bacterium]